MQCRPKRAVSDFARDELTSSTEKDKKGQLGRPEALLDWRGSKQDLDQAADNQDGALSVFVYISAVCGN